MAWGFLRRFDLPDLAACVAPRPLRSVRPVNAYGEAVTAAEWERIWLQEQEEAGRLPAGWRPNLE